MKKMTSEEVGEAIKNAIRNGDIEIIDNDCDKEVPFYMLS